MYNCEKTINKTKTVTKIKTNTTFLTLGIHQQMQTRSSKRDDQAICNHLLEETGVALLAGQYFGGNTLMQPTNLSQLDTSLNLPYFDQLKEGINRLNTWFNS